MSRKIKLCFFLFFFFCIHEWKKNDEKKKKDFVLISSVNKDPKDMQSRFWKSVFHKLPKTSRTTTTRWIVHADTSSSCFLHILCEHTIFFQYSILKGKKILYIPLIEKVESCKFLCPSNRGPFDDGVTTAESGSVGIQSGTEIFGFGLS